MRKTPTVCVSGDCFFSSLRDFSAVCVRQHTKTRLVIRFPFYFALKYTSHIDLGERFVRSSGCFVQKTTHILTEAMIERQRRRVSGYERVRKVNFNCFVCIFDLSRNQNNSIF